MYSTETIEKAAAYVRALLSGEGSGHDWWHILRVWNNAKHIARQEEADLYVVELAALLHDIGDHKFHNGDETVGPRMAREWMEQHQVEPDTIVHVCRIIAELSFKGAGTSSAMPTLEGQVVQDADRLDAIGAIGIARTFAYGGHKGREIYNPDIQPIMHESFQAYKTSAAPTINHFYEKLLLLKDRMHTKTAKAIADQRHQYMEGFLSQFYAEWNGEI
ncbi:HD domain-containing protein [Pontibacter mangrovi]|uniref:HD domain-containing protein n=1 Tax=Pontibacter mangrovi TaxID=2589816 RepID=A0A501W310_9BACT|nr:HD domain-containing protein [Pontibacter mangrovi]TPE43142.1 HD domain-containing protein [Pontibacter mangrovi]